jgi:hypothetical protein
MSRIIDKELDIKGMSDGINAFKLYALVLFIKLDCYQFILFASRSKLT